MTPKMAIAAATFTTTLMPRMILFVLVIMLTAMAAMAAVALATISITRLTGRHCVDDVEASD